MSPKSEGIGQSSANLAFTGFSKGKINAVIDFGIFVSFGKIDGGRNDVFL